jgi:hypothetical protein
MRYFSQSNQPECDSYSVCSKKVMHYNVSCSCSFQMYATLQYAIVYIRSVTIYIYIYIYIYARGALPQARTLWRCPTRPWAGLHCRLVSMCLRACRNDAYGSGCRFQWIRRLSCRFVCMYVCVHIYIYICMYVCIYTKTVALQLICLMVLVSVKNTNKHTYIRT